MFNENMKFCNNGITFDEAIETNGGHAVLSNTDILLSAFIEETSEEDMKFSNNDVCLNELVEKNGEHFILSNPEMVLNASW